MTEQRSTATREPKRAAEIVLSKHFHPTHYWFNNPVFLTVEWPIRRRCYRWIVLPVRRLLDG